MKRTMIAMLLGLLGTFALAAGPMPALYAGDNNTIAHMAGGAWIGTSTEWPYDVYYGTSALTNNANGRSASIMIYAAKMDFTLFGTFQNVAPIQGPFTGEIHTTGPDLYESNLVFFCRNVDQTIAYIMIAKGKGRNLDSATSEEYDLNYLFVPGYFTDANNDSMPDNPDEYIAVFPTHTINKRVGAAIPPLPDPPDYPPKP